MRIIGIIITFFIISGNLYAELNKINQASLDNFAKSYNYTYWDSNWKTTGADRAFSIQTSSYFLNIDYTNLAISTLQINNLNILTQEAFVQSKSETFGTGYLGSINYAILQNGAALYEKSDTPTGNGHNDSQLSEFGTWFNRRFVSTNFTNSAPVEPYFTGIEFAAWHNRMKMSFHVKPTEDITNAQLQFSVTIPKEYSTVYSSDSIFGFADAENSGFSVKAGSSAETIAVSGNTLTITTAVENFVADSSYEVSLVFYALKDNLSSTYKTIFDSEKPITITATQTDPNLQEITSITYDKNDGIHYIDIPRYNMGYGSEGSLDVIQNIELSLKNSSDQERRVRLCFRQIPNINVVGFNSMLRNANKDPSGFPLQVSKDWHNGVEMLFSGSWIREYTELIIPANQTLDIIYTGTGAKWGETFGASSHQLSVVGAGYARVGWLEAALGSFGENITHSPDYEFGNSNGCDFRPFLVTNKNYGGTSSKYSWTGNVGGLDMFVYKDASNKKIYQSQVKTKFTRYSPNLTETSISAISSDKKLKLDYTFYLNRSNDFTRVYYKVKMKALAATTFDRFDLFQLGGDVYNIYNTQKVVYGNDTGMIGEFTPTNSGGNDYTTDAIELNGSNPWVWAGDGLYYDGTISNIAINTNNAMIIRDYKACFKGIENNTPYFREYSSGTGYSASKGTNPTSYCITPPTGVTNFTAGDSMEALIEVAIFPKTDGDYYGPNENFAAALQKYGNSYKLLYRESLGNRYSATSPTNELSSTYPVTLQTKGDNGLLILNGGRGYVPVVFSDISTPNDPKLWKAYKTGWKVVDQSYHGKDFWQANYIPNRGNYDIIFNVNQDIDGDSTAVIKYYIGANPPNPSIIESINKDGEGWVQTDTIVANYGSNIVLGPHVNEYGTVSNGDNGTWRWNGPNGLTATTREFSIDSLISTYIGTYIVTYTDQFGCTAAKQFEIIYDPTLAVKSKKDNEINFYPNPITSKLYYTVKEENVGSIIAVYSSRGKEILQHYLKSTAGEIDLHLQQDGLYFLKIKKSESDSSKVNNGYMFYKKQ